jgi:hypothetical protein
MCPSDADDDEPDNNEVPLGRVRNLAVKQIQFHVNVVQPLPCDWWIVDQEPNIFKRVPIDTPIPVSQSEFLRINELRKSMPSTYKQRGFLHLHVQHSRCDLSAAVGNTLELTGGSLDVQPKWSGLRRSFYTQTSWKPGVTANLTFVDGSDLSQPPEDSPQQLRNRMSLSSMEEPSTLRFQLMMSYANPIPVELSSIEIICDVVSIVYRLSYVNSD